MINAHSSVGPRAVRRPEPKGRQDTVQPSVSSRSVRAPGRLALVFVAALSSGALLAGCGGGGSTPVTKALGVVKMKIMWPPTKSATRGGPITAVRLILHQNEKLIGTMVVSRPADNSPSSVTLPVTYGDTKGLFWETVEAHVAPDASDTPTEQSDKQLDPNELANITPDTVTVTFNPVDHVDVESDNALVQKPGGGIKLVATPKDKDGNQALVAYNSIMWSSDHPELAAVTQVLDLLQDPDPKAKKDKHEEVGQVNCIAQGFANISATDPISGKVGKAVITVSDDGRNSPFDGVWTGTLTDGRTNPPTVGPWTYSITSSPPSTINLVYRSTTFGEGGYGGTYTSTGFSVADNRVVGTLSPSGILTVVEQDSSQTAILHRATKFTTLTYFVASTHRAPAGGDIEVDFIIRNAGTQTATNVHITAASLNGSGTTGAAPGDDIYPYGLDFGDIPPGLYVRRVLVFSSEAVSSSELHPVPLVTVVSTGQGEFTPDPFLITIP